MKTDTTDDDSRHALFVDSSGTETRKISPGAVNLPEDALPTPNELLLLVASRELDSGEAKLTAAILSSTALFGPGTFLGTCVSMEALSASTGMTAEGLARAVTRMRRRGLLHVSGDFERPTFIFNVAAIERIIADAEARETASRAGVAP